MINYEGWGRPPGRPRRRHGRAVAGALCVVVVVVALLAGRSPLAGHTPVRSSATGPSAEPATDMSAAGDWTLGACIDPTLSLIPSFATTIRTDLALAIASLAPPATPVD